MAHPSSPPQLVLLYFNLATPQPTRAKDHVMVSAVRPHARNSPTFHEEQPHVLLGAPSVQSSNPGLLAHGLLS